MSLTALEIYLTKSAKISPPKAGGGDNVALVATFNRNINSIGFTLSPGLITALAALGRDEVVSICQEAEPVLWKMVGAHKKHKPMYPNFPRQVMEASDLELYLNAMTHYWGSFLHDVTGVPFRFLPEYEKDDREPLPESEVTLRVIKLGSDEDFNSIFTRLAGANGSLSESDKAVVKWFAENRRDILPKILPEAIPQKENLTFLVGALLPFEIPSYLVPLIKTATDVLRVAAAMSGGDVSLAKPTKFRRLKRAERRFLLDCLEATQSPTEDMLRRPEQFKRLGRELHAGDYPNRYPKTIKALAVVQNNEAYETFNGKVEKSLREKDICQAVESLTLRPGDFARRLDHLLRSVKGDGQELLEKFSRVANKVSTPVLLQAYAHFKNRDTRKPRVFFPKGNVAKMQLSEELLPALPPGVAPSTAGMIRGVLVGRFQKMPSLGKVYVDPALAKQIVPFSQRSASKSLRTISRGSRLPLPDCSILRFFVWWKDGESRTDLDLSAAFLGDDYRYLSSVGYYNLREHGCYHSGDITSAPKGAAEFIDLDIKKVLGQGVRYVAMCVNSYTNQPYKDLPECFAGWMARSQSQSGEVFEARTVQDRIDITCEAKMVVPLLIDLQNREAIWVDMAYTGTHSINNVKNRSLGISQTAKAIAELPKATLHDLFSMHAQARGIPSSKDEADTVFSLYEGVTPFEQDKIMSEFLA